MTANAGTDVRALLVAAGCRLAELVPRPELTAEAVAQAAGVAEREFRAAFGDEQAFLVELHRHFLGQLLDRVIPALASRPAGLGLDAGVQAFLNVCLEHKGLRALLLASETDRQIGEAALARRRGFLQMLKLEFEARGWPHAAEAARLYRAMVEEAARAELDAGQALPKLRLTLTHFIRD